jgi:succinate dehydrogenase / fumarate reductase cytochrome b subunit
MAFSKTSYIARKLFELSGFLPVGGFLIEHLYSNFMRVGEGGAARFDKVVVDLQTNPLIIFLEIGAIGLPLIYHALYGIFVATQARPNNGSYGYARNWAYTLQRITGILLFLYIGYHVWNTRLAPELHPDNPLFAHAEGHTVVTSQYMTAYFNDVHFGLPVWILYVIGISCAVYHFANGMWNIGIHWGLTVGPKAQRASGYVCGAVGLTLFALAMASLMAFVKA